MEDVFQRIEHVIRSKEQNRVFFNPNLETSKSIMQVNEVNYSKATQQCRSDHPHNGQPHPVQFNNTFRENNKQPRGPFRKSPEQQAYRHGPKIDSVLLL